jgi:1-acyl-sn-glycerol-3-phosphate acyltransferase
VERTRTRLVPQGAALAFASHARAAARAVALIALSLAAGTVGAAARVLERVVPRLGRPLERAATFAWARGAAAILGMHVEISGRAPHGPALIVANHLSYLDVVTLWVATGGVFVAKSEVASWPLVGVLGRGLGTLFLDRTRKRAVVPAIAQMQRLLGRGVRVVLFAEGTSTRGDRVLPFKSSLFEAAVRADVHVVCASVHYATPPGAPRADIAVCWWGTMTFGDHVWALLRLPRFEARVRFADGAIVGRDRKRLARAAHAAVTAVWTPVGAQSDA